MLMLTDSNRSSNWQIAKKSENAGIFTTQPAKTMPSSPADCAMMTTRVSDDKIKVIERTIFRITGSMKTASINVLGAWCLLETEIDCWIRKLAFVDSVSRSLKRKQP